MLTLKNLNAWSKAYNYSSPKSAQGYMGYKNTSIANGSCGSSCGADKENLVKASSCGSSCGAGGDK